MSLTLYYHPLASFCHKVLIARYQIETPFEGSRPRVSAYFERLVVRPSFARVLGEARPWFRSFPYVEAMPARFLDDSENGR